MPAVARVGDPSDHGGSIISTPQGCTYAEGILVAVVGASHSCPIPGHGVTSFGAGSSISDVGGAGIIRVGVDSCGCGAKPSSGSPSTFTE